MTDSVFPTGFNCYTPLMVEISDGHLNYFIVKTKICPFFVGIDNIEGRCSALDIEIIDQVKKCGINDFSDEEIIEMMNEVLNESKI